MCDAKHKTDFYQHTLNTLWFLPKCISVSIWLLNTCSLLFPEHFTFFKRRNKSCSTHEGQNFYYFSVKLTLARVIYSYILLVKYSCSDIKSLLSVCLQKSRAQRNMLSCWRNSSDLQIYLPSIGSHSNICSNISSDFVKPPAKTSWMQGL